MNHESSFTAVHTRLRGFIAQLAGAEAAGLSRSAAQHEFNELAKSLFSLQFDSVPLFQEFCVRRGISPENLKHWSDIPAIPTMAFKEHDITSLEPAQRTEVFYSSGTTQQVPGRHFHNAESMETYEASLLPWFTRNFLGDQKSSEKGMDLLVLTPSPALAPHSSLAHMFGTVSPAFGRTLFAGKIGEDGAWTLDLESTVQFLQNAVNENRFIAVVGTAFSFVHLFDHCEEKKLRWKLPVGSRVMETGGYKGRSRFLSKKELYDLITSRLGIITPHIVSEYGMSELSSQAYDTQIASFEDGKAPLTRAFQFPPWARVQIISAETGSEVDDGEIGLVRMFDLANVRSVLAIQTEDLAIRRGTGFELIGRAAQAEPRGCSLMPA